MRKLIPLTVALLMSLYLSTTATAMSQDPSEVHASVTKLEASPELLAELQSELLKMQNENQQLQLELDEALKAAELAQQETAAVREELQHTKAQVETLEVTMLESILDRGVEVGLVKLERKAREARHGSTGFKELDSLTDRLLRDVKNNPLATDAQLARAIAVFQDPVWVERDVLEFLYGHKDSTQAWLDRTIADAKALHAKRSQSSSPIRDVGSWADVLIKLDDCGNCSSCKRKQKKREREEEKLRDAGR